MGLFTVPVDITAGISEKPPFISGPSKFSDLENFVPLPESGLIERPGSLWKAEVATGTPQKALVPIDLGGRDKYIALVGHDEIRVFLRNGTEVPVYTTAGGTPDFSYLDIKTPNTILSADNLATANWTESGTAIAAALGTGPLKPEARPDPGAGENAFSELEQSGAGAAYYDQLVSGNLWQGLVELSIYVNTEIDAGANRTNNADQFILQVQDPADGTWYGITWDWGADYTSAPSVDTNSGDVVPIVETIDANTYRLGFILDPDRITPASTGNTVQVRVGLDQGGLGYGLYVGDILLAYDGEYDSLQPYIQPPEVLRHVTVGSSVFFANPKVATRSDHATLSTSFADVYGTRTFTNDTTAPPNGNGHAAGANETNVDIADAAYAVILIGENDADYNIQVELSDVSAGPVTLTGTYTPAGAAGTGPATGAYGPSEIAADLVADLNTDANNTDGGTGGNEARILEATAFDNVILLETKSKDGENWLIDDVIVTGSRGETHYRAFHNEVELLGDLPEVAKHDTRVKLQKFDESTGSDEQPEVILRFVGEGGAGSFGRGYWKEGLDYAVETTLDGATLPHVLTRVQDDSIGTITSVAYGIYFTWGEHSWDTRITGDDTSNPHPSFITPEADEDTADRFVTAVGYTQSRLVLASHANVVFSAARRSGVFHRTTIQSVPDDQRIDVTASSAGATPYFDIVSSSSQLFLRALRGVDVVTFDGVLSPRTVGIERVYSEATSELVGAQSALGGVLFAQTGPSADRIKFLTQSEDALEGRVFRSSDLSEDVPRLPGEKLHSLAWSPHYKTLFAASREKPGQISALRFDGEAPEWYRLTLNDDSVGGVAILDDDLFVLVERDSDWHLEQIPMDLDPRDGTESWEVRLDRRITDDELRSVPVFAASETTLELPYDIVDTSRMVVCRRDSGSYGLEITPASFDTATPGQHSIALTGDYTGVGLYIGEKHEHVVIPRRPTLRQRTGEGPVPASSVTMLVRLLEIAVVNTPYLDLLVRNKTTDVTIPTSAGLYPLYDGEGTSSVTLVDRGYTAVIGADANEFQVEIVNNTHKPTNIAGLEWKVEAIDRGTRVS